MSTLREAIERMATEAERVARDTDEWWNPADVASDLRRALEETT